jgi:DNA-binding CsgD family transcriptional regulator
MLAGALEDAGLSLGQAGRLPEALPLMEEARDIYVRAGARRDAARIVAALRSFGKRPGRRGPRQRPKMGWKSLTPTENEVVRLVNEGLTNANVAKRMYISSRTVETHLSHIFDKLGISSRRDLAELASKMAGSRPGIARTAARVRETSTRKSRASEERQ